MPVEFLQREDDPKGIYWRETPIIVNTDYVNQVADVMRKTKTDLHDTKGFSKERTLRWAGSIPREVWYQKIRETKDPFYWKHNKGRNMKLWLNENNAFRIGGQI